MTALDDIPAWMFVAGGALGGFVLAFGVSYAARVSRRIRNDGDPSNDWLADILDSVVDAANKGDHDTAHERLTAAAEQLKARRAPEEP